MKSRLQEDGMKNELSENTIKWLESEEAQEIIQKSLKEAEERTIAFNNSMIVTRDSLLKPVTL